MAEETPPVLCEPAAAPLRRLPFWKRAWPWAAAALSGVLLFLCFAPWNLGPLCWVALTPLIAALWFSEPSPRNARRHALLGYVAGLVFFTGTFYWLSSLGTLFGNPWLHGLPALLALYLALFLAFFAWVVGKIQPPPGKARFSHSIRNISLGLLGASAWVAQEWVRGWLFTGFGWNGLGVALHGDLAMIQICDITGVWGLSFLAAFCNVMGVLIIGRVLSEIGPMFLKKVRWEFSFSMALIAGVFAYGVRSLMAGPPASAETLRVAAVQPNISQSEKFSPASEDAVFDQIGALTGLAAATGPQLILWPEAATPRGMYADEVNYKFVMDQAAKGEFGLLIGTADSDLKNGEDYNTATLLTEGGIGLQIYRKMHLVPFGEYMPLRHSFPLFAMVAGELVPEDFTPGREFTMLSLQKPAVQFAALICFEDTLGDLTRRFVAKGAQLLVNITNDGWFLETAGAEQHLANAVFRAVENRRPLVRCANTGVTGRIDAMGRVERWLPLFESGFAVRDVPLALPSAPLTFYTRHGDWLAEGATAVTALHLLGAWWRKRRRTA